MEYNEYMEYSAGYIEAFTWLKGEDSIQMTQKLDSKVPASLG